MRAQELFDLIEAHAPLRFQEDFDNAGIQVGDTQREVTGVLLCTDVSPAVIDEAVASRCNVIISHHPLIFHGLKKLVGGTPVQRMVAKAIKHDLVIYCAHTNMDNVPQGVSFKMAQKLGMTEVEILDAHATEGWPAVGSGVIGRVEPMTARALLERVKATFEVGAVRCSGDLDRQVERVALCGGAGGFLIDKAVAAGAELFISADLRYHDFLDHNDRIVLADIGHYESEHFTKEIFYDIIQKKNPTFAVSFSKQEKNQIIYL